MPIFEGALLKCKVIVGVIPHLKCLPSFQVFFCHMSGTGADAHEECEVTAGIEAIVSISHLLLAVNSSANFIIYTMRGTEYHRKGYL